MSIVTQPTKFSEIQNERKKNYRFVTFRFFILKFTSLKTPIIGVFNDVK